MNDAVATLAALAHPTRLAIFRKLVPAGTSGLAAGKIGEMTGIAPSSLSFHLKDLAQARLIRARQEGRFVIYSADFQSMASLMAFLSENCCGGEPCELTCMPASCGDAP